jgi:hypothetical protein
MLRFFCVTYQPNTQFVARMVPRQGTYFQKPQYQQGTVLCSPAELHDRRRFSTNVSQGIRLREDEGYLDRSPFPRRLLPRFRSDPGSADGRASGAAARHSGALGVRDSAGTGKPGCAGCESQAFAKASDVRARSGASWSSDEEPEVRRAVPLTEEPVGRTQVPVGQLVASRQLLWLSCCAWRRP